MAESSRSHGNPLTAFKGILAQSGLSDIRFHDLRHTAASLMLQQEIHPKVVQGQWGHSKINIALDVYPHVLPCLKDQAAAKTDSLIAGTSPKPTQGVGWRIFPLLQAVQELATSPQLWGEESVVRRSHADG